MKTQLKVLLKHWPRRVTRFLGAGPSLFFIIFILMPTVTVFSEDQNQYGFGRPSSQRYEGELLNVKGLSLANKGDYRKVKIILKDKINKNPTDWSLHYDLGTLYLLEREFDSAIEELRKAKELDLNNVLPRVNLSAAYREKGMHAERIEEIRQAVLVDSKHDLVLLNAGIAYAEHDFLPQAVVFFKSVQPDSSYYAVSKYHQAGVYFLQGYYALAEECFRIAKDEGYNADPDFLDVILKAKEKFGPIKNPSLGDYASQENWNPGTHT